MFVSWIGIRKGSCPGHVLHGKLFGVVFPDVGDNILPDLSSITATRVESQVMDFLRMLSRFHFPRTFIEAPPFPSLAQCFQKLPAEL